MYNNNNKSNNINASNNSNTLSASTSMPKASGAIMMQQQQQQQSQMPLDDVSSHKTITRSNLIYSRTQIGELSSSSASSDSNDDSDSDSDSADSSNNHAMNNNNNVMTMNNNSGSNHHKKGESELEIAGVEVQRDIEVVWKEKHWLRLKVVFGFQFYWTFLLKSWEVSRVFRKRQQIFLWKLNCRNEQKS